MKVFGSFRILTSLFGLTILHTAFTVEYPVYFNAATGNYYQRVDVPGIDWHSARSAAEGSSYLGVQGRLVTITSQEEQDFVRSVLEDGEEVDGHWIGAFQDHSAPDYSEPSGGWKWITDEPWVYSDWGSGEPNNVGGDEDFVLLRMPLQCTWNDLRAEGLNGDNQGNGYVIEYEPMVRTLLSIADTYIRQGSPNQNQGLESLLQVRASGHNRALLTIDQGEIEAAIGYRALFSAKLRVFIEFNADNWGDGREVAIHRMTQAWTELGATWNCPDDTNTGNQSPNGPTWNMQNSALWPFQAAPTAVVEHVNGLGGWVEFDVTADVQAFLNGSATNFGWLIKKVVEGQNGRVQYSSKEGANPPQLVLTKQ